jgi:hypothetical protein
VVASSFCLQEGEEKEKEKVAGEKSKRGRPPGSKNVSKTSITPTCIGDMPPDATLTPARMGKDEEKRESVKKESVKRESIKSACVKSESAAQAFVCVCVCVCIILYYVYI